MQNSVVGRAGLAVGSDVTSVTVTPAESPRDCDCDEYTVTVQRFDLASSGPVCKFDFELLWLQSSIVRQELRRRRRGAIDPPACKPANGLM